MEGMRKVTITVTGWVSERALPLDPGRYEVDIVSAEDCFLDLFTAKIIDVKVEDDGPAGQ